NALEQCRLFSKCERAFRQQRCAVRVLARMSRVPCLIEVVRQLLRALMRVAARGKSGRHTCMDVASLDIQELTAYRLARQWMAESECFARRTLFSDDERCVDGLAECLRDL